VKLQDIGPLLREKIEAFFNAKPRQFVPCVRASKTKSALAQNPPMTVLVSLPMFLETRRRRKHPRLT
jgi:hypothetical protein